MFTAFLGWSLVLCRDTNSLSRRPNALWVSELFEVKGWSAVALVATIPVSCQCMTWLRHWMRQRCALYNRLASLRQSHFAPPRYPGLWRERSVHAGKRLSVSWRIYHKRLANSPCCPVLRYSSGQLGMQFRAIGDSGTPHWHLINRGCFEVTEGDIRMIYFDVWLWESRRNNSFEWSQLSITIRFVSIYDYLNGIYFPMTITIDTQINAKMDLTK